MDTGILDVLPVQATLIPKILLKLFLNEVHHWQPAGVWGEERAVVRDQRPRGEEGGKASQVRGVGSSSFVSNQRN